MAARSTFVSILRQPDLVRAFGPEGEVELLATGGGWEGGGATLSLEVQPERVSVRLQGGDRISRIQMRWRADLRSIMRYLGDHWERSYADMEWRGEAPNRPMPWFFMAFDGERTHGYGVATNPGAFCFWTADAEGISLWADVRSGGMPVDLHDRTLHVADVVSREGKEGESPFGATREFSGQLCPSPRLLEHPVYGTNDWNYAYGNNSAELIAGVSQMVSDLSSDLDNRPYSVVDEGWAMGPYNKRFGYGPWIGNSNFGDMAEFAQRLKAMGVRPGIWFRPLTPLDDMPDSWRIEGKPYMDPTLPEVHEHVRSHIARFVEWGYEMIKHDFTTFDLLGLWGMQMGSSPTLDGWSLYSRAKTNAEVLTDLYRTIRDAAGDARLIGCNTVGHLGAGYHEVQRTGDDTSGRSWDRNRRMGVNTLAFRAPQHGLFHQVDPDIVAITDAAPWELVEQWLRLVSESGTALFVAADPAVIEPKHREALRKALDIASKPQPVGEPLDWMDTNCPRRWRLRGREVEFNWMGVNGGWPFGGD